MLREVQALVLCFPEDFIVQVSVLVSITLAKRTGNPDYRHYVEFSEERARLTLSLGIRAKTDNKVKSLLRSL